MKKIIITILVIILILLLGLIGYQYLNNDEEIIEDEKVEINNGAYDILRGITTVEGTTSSKEFIKSRDNMNQFVKLDKLNYMSDEDKIDINLPFIYKIVPKYDLKNYQGAFEYKQFRNEFETVEEERDDVYSFPYINLNIEGIDKVNYILKAVGLNSNANHDFAYKPNYEYFVTVKDDVLSIGIKFETVLTRVHKIYNIDLKNKKILTDEEFVDKFNVTEKEIEEAIDNYTIERDDELNTIELIKEFYDEINDKDLLYGYDIDLNKDLNDFCKYDFTPIERDKYAYIIKDGCQKPDGKNFIGLCGNKIVINKYYYDELNDCYHTNQFEIIR